MPVNPRARISWGDGTGRLLYLVQEDDKETEERTEPTPRGTVDGGEYGLFIFDDINTHQSPSIENVNSLRVSANDDDDDRHEHRGQNRDP